MNEVYVAIYVVGYILFFAGVYSIVSSGGESNVGWMIVCSFLAIFWLFIVVPSIGIWIGKEIRRRIE